jgi:hypothetical protein
MNGTTHVGESATGCQYRNAVEVTVLQSGYRDPRGKDRRV